jgi:hypothetical protein
MPLLSASMAWGWSPLGEKPERILKLSMTGASYGNL